MEDANKRYAFVSFLNSQRDQTGRTAGTHDSRNGKDSRGERAAGEWVRVVSLAKSAALRRDASLVTAAPFVGADAGALQEYSVGRLVRVLEIPVSQPARGSVPEGSAAGALSLAQLWGQAGFGYSVAQAKSTLQVLVEFPPYGGYGSLQPNAGDSGELPQYAYPADKVFRLRAPISPCPSEVERINASLADGWAEALALRATAGEEVAASVDAESSEVGEPSPAGVTMKVLKVRQGFVASAGFVLLAADYSQVELRILAHFAADRDLARAFGAGEDVFRAMAARWLGRAVERDVTEAERNQVKQICYALIYGAGPSLVAQQAGVSVAVAQGMMRDFLRCYPGVQRFLQRAKKQCRREGYVQTLLGRRRCLPDICNADTKKKARAERQAVNTLCQGSAADLIKVRPSDRRISVCSYVPVTFVHLLI